MGDASYVQYSFLGGEISKFAQGRYDRQDYRTCMVVCLNGHPVETGAWTRRAGTQHAGTTRGGAAGRVVRFDFQQSSAYTMEFTDGHVRFRVGPRLANTNDTVGVAAISGANPAVLKTASAVTWATGDTVIFNAITSQTPTLADRQFTLTKSDTTHFSLADAVTGAAINGATLGTLAGGETVSRVQDLVSPFTNQQWLTLRSVQAETNAVLLQGVEPPQILRVTTLPAGGMDAQFSLSALTFLDGPYLDPFTNGVQATPSAKTGTITLTLAFPAYDSTKAYKVGDFVTSSSVNYVSIADDNVNNTPASSASFWTATSAAAAINNGQGFTGGDIGRLVRLLSEPAAWAVGTGYSSGNVVSYNATGQPGNATYWQAQGSTTGNVPGTDLTNWKPVTTGASVWSWGRILSLANQVSQTLSGAANIGDMANGGGLAAAFDGVISQTAAASAGGAHGTFVADFNTSSYVGRNFTGASAQKIASVTLYPPTDAAFCVMTGNSGPNAPTFAINLRAKASLPSNSSDGTLLATTGTLAQGSPILTAPLSLVSNDQNTAWNYLWTELTAHCSVDGAFGGVTVFFYCAELQQFNPPGTGSTASAVVIELLGPPLLYTTPVQTWRLGVYSPGTGYPTCGCYHEGRIWLMGAVGNRFDASVSNGLSGTTINFAPTDQNGIVTAASAISYTIDSKGVNQILWAQSDLQGVLMGTQAGEWLASAPTAGPIAANNIKAVPAGTHIGSSFIEPARTEHTTLFVHRYGRKLMELFPDVISGKFTAPNLAKDAMHLTKPGIAELAWTQAVVPIVWGRNTDGSLWGITYKRDTLSTASGPSANGWHPHTLGSGRVVESICAGPSVGGSLDALTMVTNDTSTNVRHVEIVTDAAEEDQTLAEAMYLDDAVNPVATSTTNVASGGAPYGGLTLCGLWHLNGKTVQAWIGGIDCGLQEAGAIADFTVANGQITIPYGDGVSAGSGAGKFTAGFAAGVPLAQMWVGFTFTSQGQLVRPNSPADSGARTGPAFGKKRRNHNFAVQAEGTQGVSFGTDFTKLLPALFRSGDSRTILTMDQQFTGIHWDQIKDDYSYDGMLCWQTSRPYITNIVAIGPRLETQD